MNLLKTLLLSLVLMVALGCAKKTVQAPVGGTIDSFDATYGRAIGDAETALIQAKTWETCSDQKFPASVVFDAHTYLCDATAGPFPPAGRPFLFRAEQTHNIFLAAAEAYHAGATSDTTALTAAVTQLGIDVGDMLVSIGKGK